jgi:hypothetical protein
VPSLRNSGFETTAKGCFVSEDTTSLTRAAVPTGTVDLFTMILKPFIARAMPRATSSTWVRSAEPSSSCGVPTAMKITSLVRTASSRSVVKRRRSSATLRGTISLRPGS